MSNGSTVIIRHASDLNSSSDSIIHGLGAVVFWGAQTYMHMNIIHLFACLIVILINCMLPVVDKNLYNRLVLRHNVSLFFASVILTLLGYCQLSQCPFDEVGTRVLWLVLQYFTNATVFWLNVVCFDMTLVIPRFSWMPQVPDEFPLKADFTESSNGPKPIVNMYFFLLPACTLLCNNFLFVVTTYNIVQVQRSTKIASKNQANSLRKSYFLFLRLYLLMGAPWFFGMVLACFNKLAVLKVCRMLQPVLWLAMLASRKKIREQLTRSFVRLKSCENNAIGSNETVNIKLNDHAVFTIPIKN